MQTVARPTNTDERLVQLVADKLLANIDDNGDPEGTREDLVEVLRSCHDWDGYVLASELDDWHGWGVDAEMVGELDWAESYRSEIRRQLVADWVKENGIQCRFDVGAQVLVVCGEWGERKERRGEIVSVDRVHAQYTVRVPELGHGQPGSTTIGVIINEEEVKGAE